MFTFCSCEQNDKCIYQNEMSWVFKQGIFVGKYKDEERGWASSSILFLVYYYLVAVEDLPLQISMCSVGTVISSLPSTVLIHAMLSLKIEFER